MKRYCFLLIFSLIEITIQAASNIRITPVPSLPQLPVSAIHRIFQDSEGLMWYGTVNGLLLFDPSAPKDSIYTYSPLPVNPMGETEGDILYLEQDNREGILDDYPKFSDSHALR